VETIVPENRQYRTSFRRGVPHILHPGRLN
jgi:hypothetical protein